ncbi:dihydropteroate synthase [Alphaproteobacteria bacterium]|nr:dihydropteroate synthase [Alphaproteobacteria bacterium]
MNTDAISGLAYEAAPKVPPFCQPTWLRPITAPSGQHKLAGGHTSFSQFDVVMADGSDGYLASRMDCEQLFALADDRNMASKAIDDLTIARQNFAGLNMGQSHLMGVLNVTPDSFSDGGVNLGPAKAIAAGKAMAAAGASIIDIGGESTRPGAEPVSRNQELVRILPPVTGLARTDLLISVDTRHAAVMTRAIAAGAAIINDVDALQGEGAMKAAAASGAPVVMMHMKGTPETMQQDPVYDFAPVEIYEFLKQRVAAAIAAGIPASSIAIDPGFGFAKTVTHNLQLVNWLSLFHGLGVVVLFGASRKSSIAKISAGEPAEARLAGSLVLAAAAWRQGAQIIRVHDIAETAQALAVEAALRANDR